MNKAYYVIEVTYPNRTEEVKDYILKGGYVTSSPTILLKSELYNSLGFAQKRCRELAEENEQDLKLYKWAEPEHYEPYEVTHDNIVI